MLLSARLHRLLFNPAWAMAHDWEPVYGPHAALYVQTLKEGRVGYANLIWLTVAVPKGLQRRGTQTDIRMYEPFALKEELQWVIMFSDKPPLLYGKTLEHLAAFHTLKDFRYLLGRVGTSAPQPLQTLHRKACLYPETTNAPHRP